mmetsp:Transcript_42965/g.115771  ORF Transcript_42965/g.115771 Transcript_42965/m.115771 type:complete len:211 (+) Transcript_42965:813-1445(+)
MLRVGHLGRVSGNHTRHRPRRGRLLLHILHQHLRGITKRLGEFEFTPRHVSRVARQPVFSRTILRFLERMRDHIGLLLYRRTIECRAKVMLRRVARHLAVSRPVKVLRPADEALVARDACPLVRWISEHFVVAKERRQRLIHLAGGQALIDRFVFEGRCIDLRQCHCASCAGCTHSKSAKASFAGHAACCLWASARSLRPPPSSFPPHGA